MPEARSVGSMIPGFYRTSVTRTCSDCRKTYEGRTSSRYCWDCRVDRMEGRHVSRVPTAPKPQPAYVVKPESPQCVHQSFDVLTCKTCRRKEGCGA